MFDANNETLYRRPIPHAAPVAASLLGRSIRCVLRAGCSTSARFCRPTLQHCLKSPARPPCPASYSLRCRPARILVPLTNSARIGRRPFVRLGRTLGVSVDLRALPGALWERLGYCAWSSPAMMWMLAGRTEFTPSAAARMEQYPTQARDMLPLPSKWWCSQAKHLVLSRLITSLLSHALQIRPQPRLRLRLHPRP